MKCTSQIILVIFYVDFNIPMEQGKPGLVWYLNVFFFKGFYLFIFRERGREGEKEGEKHHPCAKETSVSCLSHTPK